MHHIINSGILRTWSDHPTVMLAALKAFVQLANCLRWGFSTPSSSAVDGINGFITYWGAASTIGSLVDTLLASPISESHRQALLLQVMEAITAFIIPDNPASIKALHDAGIMSNLFLLLQNEPRTSDGCSIRQTAYGVLITILENLPPQCPLPILSAIQTIDNILSSLSFWDEPEDAHHVSLHKNGWGLFHAILNAHCFMEEEVYENLGLLEEIVYTLSHSMSIFAPKADVVANILQVDEGYILFSSVLPTRSFLVLPTTS